MENNITKVKVNEYEEYVISMVNDSDEGELVVGHVIDDWDTMNKTICTEDQMIEVKHGCGTCEQTFPRLDDLNKHKLFCPVNYDIRREALQSEEPQLLKKKARLCFCCEEEIIDAHKGNIQCTKCDLKFYTHFGRDRHTYLLHAEDTEYQCNLCNAVCRTIRIFDLHMIAQHAPIRPFTCDFCGRSFLLKSNLAMHLKQPLCSGPNNEKALSCTECKQKFTNINDIYEHIHNGVGLPSKKLNFQCSYCDKSFCALPLLSMHSRSHKDVKMFPCEECDKSYGNIGLLRKHRQIHTVQGSLFKHQRLRHVNVRKSRRRIRPRGRPRKSNKIPQVKMHKDDMNWKREMLIDEEPYKCTFCEETFNSTQERVQHVISIHTNDWPHKCEICDECFLGNEDHKAHMLQHINNPVVLETVPLQNEQVESKTISSLNHRIAAEVNNYKCRHCDKRFKFPQQRLRHTYKFHKDEHFHTCKICNKSYMWAEALVKHMKCHTGHHPNSEAFQFRNKIEIKEEPPLTIEPENQLDSDERSFKCRFCEKSFTFIQERIRHVIMYHTNERPHQCDICDKIFVNAEELNLHKIHHTDETLIIDSGKVQRGDEITATTEKKSRHIKFSHTNQDITFDDLKTQENPHIVDKESIIIPDQTSHNCLFCGNCYTQEEELRAHMIHHMGGTMSINAKTNNEVKVECAATGKSNRPIHSGSEPYKCPFCDKSFKFRQQRLQHVKISHTDQGRDMNHHIGDDITLDANTFQLEDERLPNRKGKLLHRNSCDPNKCRFCERSFKFRTQRWRHVKFSHPDQWPHKCEICGIIYSRAGQLKKHMVQHSKTVEEVDPLQIEEATLPEFKVIIESHHNSPTDKDLTNENEKHCRNLDGRGIEILKSWKERPYKEVKLPKAQCIDSNKLRKTMNLKNKIAFNNARPYTFMERPNKCRFCERSFKFREQRSRHVKMSHPDIYPHKCEVCDARFFKPRKLEEHMIYHVSDGMTVNADTLQNENEIMAWCSPLHMTHTMKQMHKCVFCDKSFSQTDELDAHMIHHIGATETVESIEFQMGHVAKTSTSTLPAHTVQQLLKCRFCEKSFKFRQQRLRHVKISHPDQPLHQCKICFASFFRASGVKRHMVHRHGNDVILQAFAIRSEDDIESREYNDTEISSDVTVQYQNAIKSGCTMSVDSYSPLHNNEMPNKCRYCEKSFKFRQQRSRHVKTSHPNQWSYKCEICHARFFRVSALIAHKVQHSGNKAISYAINVQNEFQRTIESHRDIKTDECLRNETSLCNKENRNAIIYTEPLQEVEIPMESGMSYKSFSSLDISNVPYKNRYIKFNETIKRSTECLFSDESFLQPEHKDDEVDSENSICSIQTGEKSKKCRFCDRSFKFRQQRSRHVQINHPDQCQHKCEICQTSFSRAGELKRHMLYHVSDGGVTVNSDTIQNDAGMTKPHLQNASTFVDEDHDNEIIIEVSPQNEEEINAQCPISNKSQSPVDTNEIPLKCRFCERSFKYRTQRWRHVKISHPEHWPHKCEICYVSFFGARAFRKHMVRHKTNRVIADVNTLQNENEMMLDQDKIETECTKDDLKIHSTLDTVEIVFKCPYCDKPFKCSQQRIRHIKTSHIIEGPHKCQFCGTSFFQVEKLESHMVHHIGATVAIDAQILQKNDQVQTVSKLPYKCAYCDGSFKFREQRSRHVKRIHPDQLKAHMVYHIDEN